MNRQAPLRQAGIGSRGSLLWVWDGIWCRLVGPRVSETSVRQTVLQQAGVATIDSVSIIPGPTGRRQTVVRIRIAEGYDAREVICQATEALIRDPSGSEFLVLASAGNDTPAAR